MKKIYLLFSALILTASCQTGKTIVVTYPAIESLQTSDVYSVTVNGQPVWTEKLESDMDLSSLPSWFTSEPHTQVQQQIHVANFSCNGKISVHIAVKENINQAFVRPRSRGISPKIEKKAIDFSLPGPDKLYIQINDLPPLCLFANPLETDIPDSTDPNVTWFGPGVHRVGLVRPEDNAVIYIAGGAIVYGGIETDSVSNIRILGRGILDGDYKLSRMVKLQNSSNILFNGVIIRRGRSWTNTIINCDDVLYRHVKVISFRPGGDGINPLNSRNVKIDSCFLRCTDDCIAIKAPNPTQNVENIQIYDNTMVGYAFSDGVTIGFETNGPEMRDIHIKNCDILQARGGSRVDGHSAFSIICDGPARISNVLFEDIRVEEDVLKLFELHITDGTKYGIDPPGHIQGVRLKNINWASKRLVILKGFSQEHMVRDVVYEDCTIAGEPLTEADPEIFRINEFVENVRFFYQKK
ncbi:hypothetical protein JW935_19630 [candidate division KSB1 bacterium]|nr:hypothetical protein [candidate division KSB1 bacterium]